MSRAIRSWLIGASFLAAACNSSSPMDSGGAAASGHFLYFVILRGTAVGPDTIQVECAAGSSSSYMDLAQHDTLLTGSYDALPMNCFTTSGPTYISFTRTVPAGIVANGHRHDYGHLEFDFSPAGWHHSVTYGPPSDGYYITGWHAWVTTTIDLGPPYGPTQMSGPMEF